MAGNIIGKIFRLTSFGESHGSAIGGVIDGCPAGIELSMDFIQEELNRRRPGQSDISTSRQEEDRVEFLSGIFEGKTTGMPIGFVVYNRNQNSADYEHLKDLYRPSHADYSWERKYGIRDYRGGGRASAREHIARVVAGAVAKHVLAKYGIIVRAWTSQIGKIALPTSYQWKEPKGPLTRPEPYLPLKLKENEVRCPDPDVAKKMMTLLHQVRKKGDSVGGVVSAVITYLPAGIGEPVFDRFQARLAHAMMSINAAKGFEYGSGFAAAAMYGSVHNDLFELSKEKSVAKHMLITTKTNHSGGIQGGVTNGQKVLFRVAFKPVPTIQKCQKTLNRACEEVEFEGDGRHDVCVVPRAVPVVEAMAAIVTLDMVLENNAKKLLPYL